MQDPLQLTEEDAEKVRTWICEHEVWCPSCVGIAASVVEMPALVSLPIGAYTLPEYVYCLANKYHFSAADIFNCKTPAGLPFTYIVLVDKNLRPHEKTK